MKGVPLAMREIVHFPNKILTTPTNKVLEIDKDISDLISDMKYIANQDNILGVAANQVGESKSILIAQGIAYINPEIIDKSKARFTNTEGCLSFPGLEVKVRRSKNILVRYLTEEGEIKTEQLHDLAAIVVQHEIDHLLGLTFLDKLLPYKKRILWKRYRKSLGLK